MSLRRELRTLGIDIPHAVALLALVAAYAVAIRLVGMVREKLWPRRKVGRRQ